MTKYKLRHIAAYIAAVAAIFAAGCRENTIINTNITPAGDSIYTQGESIPIVAKTIYSHFITSTYISGAVLVKGIGHIGNDPELGSTNISLYMQVIPKQSAGYVLPDTNKIDSIVLVLPYHGFTYGDTSGSASAQEYSVYEVTDTMAKASTYYDFSDKPYNNVPLGQKTVNFASLNDSVFVEGKNQAPHLRIVLSGMKEKLKNANYNSYSDFFNSFKGLYIKATENISRNNIPFFRLTDDGSGTNYSKAGIVVYYRDDLDSAKTDLFVFNGDNSAHFNKVVNTYSALDTANYVYLQSRPGLSVEINTTNLKTQPNRLVSKAEIVITEAYTGSAATYFAPNYVYPYMGGSDTTLTAIADAIFTSPGGTQASGLGFINGKAKKVIVNGQSVNQYIINVPREFQKALKEGKEMSILITGVTEGYYTGAFRLKAHKNSGNPTFDIRLNVVYSSVQ